MKGTYSSYSMYAYVLSQTGNDAEFLVPELLKHVTDIQLEKYQVLHTGVHVLRSACFSYIGCPRHCIVGVYNNVYTAVEKTSILTPQSPQDSMYLVLPRSKNTLSLSSLHFVSSSFYLLETV